MTASVRLRSSSRSRLSWASNVLVSPRRRRASMAFSSIARFDAASDSCVAATLTILLSSSLRPCSASARAASRTVEHSAAVVASKGSVCAARETMAGVDIGSTCDNNRAVAAALSAARLCLSASTVASSWSFCDASSAIVSWWRLRAWTRFTSVTKAERGGRGEAEEGNTPQDAVEVLPQRQSLLSLLLELPLELADPLVGLVELVLEVREADLRVGTARSATHRRRLRLPRRGRLRRGARVAEAESGDDFALARARRERRGRLRAAAGVARAAVRGQARLAVSGAAGARRATERVGRCTGQDGHGRDRALLRHDVDLRVGRGESRRRRPVRRGRRVALERLRLLGEGRTGERFGSGRDRGRRRVGGVGHARFGHARRRPARALQLGVEVEVVDGEGLVPVDAMTERESPNIGSDRRFDHRRRRLALALVRRGLDAHVDVVFALGVDVRVGEDLDENIARELLRSPLLLVLLLVVPRLWLRVDRLLVLLLPRLVLVILVVVAVAKHPRARLPHLVDLAHLGELRAQVLHLLRVRIARRTQLLDLGPELQLGEVRETTARAYVAALVPGLLGALCARRLGVTLAISV
ncbi:hypothetical protein DMC30DRAFT_22424 [Rhodotorula diobovata]|uniref:Uncharacterized protein n=1 Tax=Rhodotorula diobovata TaxID=5288 RepID=A0A5C5G6D3_9BASI|nr:hypothetical protein DMC30DRAFT_22424 [Rhodotorula diobovata]